MKPFLSICYVKASELMTEIVLFISLPTEKWQTLFLCKHIGEVPKLKLKLNFNLVTINRSRQHCTKNQGLSFKLSRKKKIEWNLKSFFFSMKMIKIYHLLSSDDSANRVLKFKKYIVFFFCLSINAWSSLSGCAITGQSQSFSCKKKKKKKIICYNLFITRFVITWFWI